MDCIREHRLENGFELGGRTADDLQHLGCRALLLPRLGELTGARFKLLFQLDQRIGLVANVRSRLRSGRTRLAVACWTICAFERQGSPRRHRHWPPSGRPGQTASWSILTEPHDEL